MKTCFVRRYSKAGLTIICGILFVWSITAQTNSPVKPADQAAQDKEACTTNLRVIYDAIQAYEKEQKDLPNWLSDLVPQYLADANVLTCPVCRRTGQIEAGALADPAISTSYLFEFCPVPLGTRAPNSPSRTRREWKRRQMGLVGPIVPIVRCRHHNPLLNLAFDGRIYESPNLWEHVVTNQVSTAELTAERIFADEPAPPAAAAGKMQTALSLPARDPKLPKELIDLNPFYNAGLTQSWHGNSNNSLAELPSGGQPFNGVEFDARGIIQLGGKGAGASKYPPQVKGIPVHQKCRHLQFLHAAGFGRTNDEGVAIGSYLVHFATNRIVVEIPIVYGQEVRNWHAIPGEPAPGKDLKVAWTGQNPVSKRAGTSIRLFMTTWPNVLPDVEIERIDFVSSMGTAAPFLIALTVD